MVNQAVILCGGLGKRLMPLTKHTPKPMVMINKKPFLEYLIYQLKSNGLTNILILGGYRSEQIKNYFQNGKNFGVKIEYSNGPIDWDTGTRVFKAEKKLNKFFLLFYSKNIFSFNLQKIKKNFNKEKNIYFILKKKEIGNFSIFKDEIKSYSIKRSKKKNFVELGFSIIKSQSLINYFNKSNKTSINNFYLDSFRKKKVGYSIHDDLYCSIGDSKRLLETKKFLKLKKIIFIDRDGTINKSPGKGKYLIDEKKIKYEQEIVKMMKVLSKKGYQFIIITNQAGIALNKLSLSKLKKINDKIIKDLTNLNITILDLFFCPHHWDDNCRCRKPKAGMFYDASKKYMINLSNSIYIGDDIRDMMASENANCKGIFFNDSQKLNIIKEYKFTNLLLQSKKIDRIKKTIFNFYEN